jgi:diketogulonate reductase-like aldo/keto reductase
LELIEFCQKNDILVEAYSPIAHGAVLDNTEVKVIADKYGVSVAQLCLRYCLQLGLVVIPKTANPDHMRNNVELDFAISDSDMETLMNVEHIQNYGEHSFFPVFGGKLK